MGRKLTGRRLLRWVLVALAGCLGLMWLTFGPQHTQRPLICEMSRKHDLIFDIRSANVTPELGLMALELTGNPQVIEAAIKWLQRHGVQVDPI